MPKRLVVAAIRFTHLALWAVVLSITGCDKQDEAQTSVKVDPVDVSPVDRAAEKLASGHLEEAAELIQDLLISEPSDEVLLLAATIESQRLRHQRAIELLTEIDLAQSPDSEAAATLLIQQAMRTRDMGLAEETLRTMTKVQQREPRWRHQLWQLLNHEGRRQEASEQADALCRIGQARTEHLISLIRRSEVFPVGIDSEPPLKFESWSPLRRARWYNAAEQYDEAESQLVSSSQPSPARDALLLRVLAEQQKTDAFERLHAKRDERVLEMADYWCGVGRYWMDEGDYGNASGALLRAVRIDPTMRVAFQRLHQCMNAIGRREDAKQFRYRGVAIAETETMGRRVTEDPSNREVKTELAAMLLPLARPLEALAWSGTMISSKDLRRQQMLTQKRRSILRLADSDTVAFENALLGLELDDFPVDPLAAFGAAVADSGVPRSESALPPSDRDRTPKSPSLVNVAAEVGADFQWYHDASIELEPIALYESVGGGIASLDYDLDGWPDLYFAQAGCQPDQTPSRRTSELRRNVEAEFVDVTQNANASDFHYSSGIAAGDVNQDGFPDLFLGSFGKNRLLLNNGDGTFRDATDLLDQSSDHVTASVAIADINGDALPDLFEVNYVERKGGFAEPMRSSDGTFELPSPLLFLPQSDRYFLADGRGGFSTHPVATDTAEPATGLGIIICDFDGKPGNEVFVGNDLRENHFFEFSEETLVESAALRGLASGFSGLANGCMGIATGDFDRNGTLDMHVSNYRGESDNLFLQFEPGMFRDVAVRRGLRESSYANVAFGSKAIDFDRNGWLDLAVTNGHIFDMRFMNQGYKMKPSMLMSDGNRFVPTVVQDASGYWEQRFLGRSMVLIDYNRDGRSDLVVGHLEAPTALLENQTATTGASIQFELIGTASERDAIGAKVTLFAGARSTSQWVTAGDGYFCSDEPYLEIVVPNADSFERVEVDWPSGEKSELSGGPANRRYLIIEGEDQLIDRGRQSK
ncbi:MAG: CRTAC1 family protein [Planctomycetota bacterium]